MSRRDGWPPSMTSIFGRVPPMSAMSAGAWPTCCPARVRQTCGTPTAGRPSSSPRTWIRRRWRHSVPNSSPASPWVVVPRPGTRRSSRGVSGSRSCSASVERRQISRHWHWAWSMADSDTLSSSPMTPISRRPPSRPTSPTLSPRPTAATSGSLSARMSDRSSRRRLPLGPVQQGSAWSGPSCCSSGGRRRPQSPSNARPMPASGTPSRISRSSSGRSTSEATSPPRGRRAASRRTPPSASAASASVSIDQSCSMTS